LNIVICIDTGAGIGVLIDIIIVVCHRSSIDVIVVVRQSTGVDVIVIKRLCTAIHVVIGINIRACAGTCTIVVVGVCGCTIDGRGAYSSARACSCAIAVYRTNTIGCAVCINEGLRIISGLRISPTHSHCKKKRQGYFLDVHCLPFYILVVFFTFS